MSWSFLVTSSQVVCLSLGPQHVSGSDPLSFPSPPILHPLVSLPRWCQSGANPPHPTQVSHNSPGSLPSPSALPPGCHCSGPAPAGAVLPSTFSPINTGHHHLKDVLLWWIRCWVVSQGMGGRFLGVCDVLVVSLLISSGSLVVIREEE